MNDEYKKALERVEREAAALDMSALYKKFDEQTERIQHLAESTKELFTELLKKVEE